MEFLPNLLGLAGMHILMAMLPGPNTVVVTWLSATKSRSDGLTAVAGIVLASLIWVGFALWGVVRCCSRRAGSIGCCGSREPPILSTSDSA